MICYIMPKLFNLPPHHQLEIPLNQEIVFLRIRSDSKISKLNNCLLENCASIVSMSKFRQFLLISELRKFLSI